MNMPPLPNEVTTEYEKRVTFPVILFLCDRKRTAKGLSVYQMD